MTRPVTPPPCSCGEPATRQVSTGHVHRAGTWRPAYTFLCEACEAEASVERERGRAS